MLKSPFKSKSFVFAFCFSTVIIVSTLFFFSVGFVGYHLVALVLLMLLSVFAMLFDIVPVYVSRYSIGIDMELFFHPPNIHFSY
jgi:two-component system, OmpR family, sensor histidine kinase KdpD